MKNQLSNDPFVTKLDPSLAKKLQADLLEQGFDLTQPQYTFFAAKKKGISCTFYTSGKLVVQGKEKGEFIEFYLEPEVLKDFSYTHAESTLDLTSRIGVDESGKGDFFGPLCIAGVYADEEGVKALRSLGARDSKGLSDQKVIAMGKEIQKVCTHHIVKINPTKYNELYPKFGNLNTFLGWGHATVIEQLVDRTGCQKAIIDQFASESVVIRALKKKQISLELTQRHRAEEDLVVAAASVLARMTFLLGLEQLSKKYGVPLAKGASPQVIQAGKAFVQKHGKEMLKEVGKLHFKTLDQILGG